MHSYKQPTSNQQSLAMNAATVASQVCAHCKSRKRRCDKTLPSCSRCVMLHIDCQYGNDPQFLTSFNGPQSGRPLAKPQSNAVVLHESSTCSRPHVPTDMLFHCPYMTLLLNHSGCQSQSPMRFEIPNLDGTFVTQACAIIAEHGDNIKTITATYFSTIHCWLPIINKKKLYRRLITFQTAPSAEVAMLLLCVYLAIQLPDPSLHQIPSHSTLYNMVKYFYSLLQTAVNPSLELVQCGVLISVYEHGQGMSQAAYMSIGTCARMGYVLELHIKRDSESLGDVGAVARREEETRVWWGVIILDRIINLKDMEKGYPLAAQNPSHNYDLPLDDAAWKECRSQHLSYPSLSASLSSTVRVGNFGRAAQAAYLLGLVIEFVSTSNIDLSGSCAAAAAQLDCSLQYILMTIFKESEGSYALCCDSISMCISALFVLHRYLLCSTVNVRSINREEGVSNAMIAINTATKIVLDTLYNANMECEGPETLPIQSTHILYQAALMHITLADNDYSEIQWSQDFELLKQSLRDCGARWRIADDYVDLIEKAAATYYVSHETCRMALLTTSNFRKSVTIDP